MVNGSSGRGPVASVVIPAHNEGSVIGRCLPRLLADARPGEFEIVVVANGCTDDTAAVAARFGPDVMVVELVEASKAAALNAGDAAVHAFPRAYVDADTELSAESLRKVLAVLGGGQALSAAPSVEWDLEHSSSVVKAFYRAFLRLPYAATSSAGVYVLSAEGRARFDDFPELTADDLFVRNLFADDERSTVADAQMVIRAPRTVRSLLAVRRRVYRGNAQYLESGNESKASPTFDPGAILRIFRSDPIAATVFVALNGVAKLQSGRSVPPGTWERDDSSRV